MQRLPHFVKTDRLVVRLWVVEDAEDLNRAQAESRYHLVPWMPWASIPPLNLTDRKAQILQFTDEWEHGRDAILGVFREQEIVGGIGLHRRVGSGGLEIGYWTHVNHVRKGYGAEAAEGLTTAAFQVPEVDHIEIHHDRANKPSSGIPRKLGYLLTAKKTRKTQTPSESGVQYTWKMTKDAWQGRD